MCDPWSRVNCCGGTGLVPPCKPFHQVGLVVEVTGSCSRDEPGYVEVEGLSEVDPRAHCRAGSCTLLSCHIWSCHILSGRTKYDCNIRSGQNMTTNLLVIFRPPLQYFVHPINSILRLPYHAWDHRISHNCKGRRNRSEFVIIF